MSFYKSFNVISICLYNFCTKTLYITGLCYNQNRYKILAVLILLEKR